MRLIKFDFWIQMVQKFILQDVWLNRNGSFVKILEVLIGFRNPGLYLKQSYFGLFENQLLRDNENKNQDKLLNFFINELKYFQEYMPVISALGNEDLKERHWKMIFEKLNFTNPSKQFNFQDLLGMNVL